MNNILKKLNMKEVAESTGISYNILKNYSNNRTKNLNPEHMEKIKKFLEDLINTI